MKKLFRNLMFTALAAVTFVACEDVPEPYDRPGTGTNVPGTSTEIEGSVGLGTLESPFNSIAALNYGNKLASGEESTDYMYIKGKVVSIKEEFSTQYGNATFYISDDGTTANQFYAYRVLYLGNKKFAAGDTQIQVGDSVIVCGKITNYNGTIETAQGSAFLYQLNNEKRGGEPSPATPAAEAKGDGTLANPYNVSAVLSYIKSLGKDVESEKDVYIKGKISKITEEFGTQFGNGTFYISDDGNQSNEFYVYRTLYLENKKFAAGDTQIQVGDSVIICGKVVNFKGNTPETVANKSYLYKLNETTSGGGGDTPTPTPTPTGDNILPNGDFEAWTGEQPDNWKSACSASSATLSQSTDAHGGSYSVMIAGNATQNKRLASKEITLKAGTYTFSFYAKSTTADAAQLRPGYVPVNDGSVGSYSYGSYASVTNTEWTLISHSFTLSAQTTVCLVIMSPKSSDYATSQDMMVDDATLVTSDGGLADGGSGDESGQSGTSEAKTISVADFLAAAESTTVWYQLTGKISNLKANDLYGNFDLTDETGSVYVYGVLSEKGGAKKLFQELVSAHDITNGTTITIIGNRGSYNGKIEVTNAYFVSASNE